MWVASNTCGLIQLRFSNVTNEVQVGDLVEAMLVLDDVKLTSKAEEIVNGCVTWTPSPPFRAFLERFVLAVEKFMIESKHINQAFATCFFYSIFLIEGLEHFPHILGRSIPINSYFSERLKPPNKFFVDFSPHLYCLCYFCLLERLFLAVKVHGWHDIARIAEVSQEKVNLFD